MNENLASIRASAQAELPNNKYRWISPGTVIELLDLIDQQKRDLATFGKDTTDTENRIINAEFDAQSLRVTGEAFRMAVVQSGALNSVPQTAYFDQLRAFETALAAR